MLLRKTLMVFFAVALVCAAPAMADELTSRGAPDLKSAGPLAFAPEGVLLVGDPTGAAVFAIETGDTSGDPDKVSHRIEGIGEKVAAALGTQASDILINDLAVNPLTGNVFLSVSRGRGPGAAPVLLKVDGLGKISEVSLKDVKFSKAALPNPPAPGGEGRRNRRAQAITDLAFMGGRVIVAGLSNEEFASNLRALPYPFTSADKGASVEIFHGAHGRFETRSPVRTLALYDIAGDPYVLAAYTCTPLVRIPLKQLVPGRKVRGTTIAELGNRNRPLDMIIYKSGGKDFILMANNNRGVMKISTEKVDRKDGITEKIRGKAGQSYETIESLKGVVQLDRLNKGNAVILVRAESGALSLRTIALP